MRIEELNAETASKYKDEIVQLYYENVRSCSRLEQYTLAEARDKIEGFIHFLEDGLCFGFGLLRGEEICGFLWAYPYQFRGENRVYINEIRIREEFRGRGYGKSLLKAVEQKSKEMGISALYLHAEANNPGAIQFYAACGYMEERIQFRKKIL